MKAHKLKLGQCSGKLDALHKIHAWAKNSKSFSIERIERYEYCPFKNRMAYFSVEVQYFSTKKEGKYQIGKWDYKKHLLYKTERFVLLKNS